MKRWIAVFGAASVAAFLSTMNACNGPGGGGGCHYETWRGTCALRGVQTEKIVERFPQSFVIVAATYEPVSRAGEFSPPPFKKEMMTPAEFEADLTEFLKKQSSIDCSVDNPVGDPCAPKMVAAMPQFVPPATATAPTGPVGCAKIERQSGAPPVPSTATLPGPFQFDADSSLVTDEIRSLADAAAQAIVKDSKIECVAIKGNTAPGETFALANERAQAVKRLLQERGIDRTRITVFEATAPTYTASPDDQPAPAAKQRRVNLAVVVYGQ